MIIIISYYYDIYFIIKGVPKILSTFDLPNLQKKILFISNQQYTYGGVYRRVFESG